MVKYVANRIALRLPPHIELDDLVSVEVLGLIDTIQKYDSTHGAKFKTYAEFRVSQIHSKAVFRLRTKLKVIIAEGL